MIGLEILIDHGDTVAQRGSRPPPECCHSRTIQKLSRCAIGLLSVPAYFAVKTDDLRHYSGELLNAHVFAVSDVDQLPDLVGLALHEGDTRFSHVVAVQELASRPS